ncbi:hypothetical protein EDB87DRAFT_1821482 [Lactarius vividus]|nr:hypothetical protein EDB87DRAFT_1821482 [Lactarius vividus]
MGLQISIGLTGRTFHIKTSKSSLWLDESFARYLDQTKPSVRVSPPVEGPNTSAPSPRSLPPLPFRRDNPQASQNTGPDHLDVILAILAVGRRNLPPVLSQRGPVRPLCTALEDQSFDQTPGAFRIADAASYKLQTNSADPVADLQMSFPPSAETGSAAADLAWYMHPSTSWDTDCMCWFSMTYGSGPPVRWARFWPCPEPVAAFAVRAEASGRPVAHGECWDIAHEALLHAATLCAPHDAPVLSTSRAHGHLLFCGRPGRRQLAWRGRPPSRGRRRRVALDGDGVRPADVGVLTVVEQTVGRAPRRESYDLAKLQEGEVWVYRPVGMVEYLGSTLSIDIPSGLETYAL